MADELIMCGACGTKNASHRTVCLSCGGDLSALKDRTEIPTRSFMKRVASVVKRINTPWGWSVAALFVVGMYFILTWFFFGSSHPCGILEARQRSYVVKYFTKRYKVTMPNGSKYIVEFPPPEGTGDDEKYISALYYLHQRISINYTPAGCFWEALAWNPDPYKGSPPLKDSLKAEK